MVVLDTLTGVFVLSVFEDPKFRSALCAMDELTRQLALERRYAVVAESTPAGDEQRPDIATILGTFEHRVVAAPDLAPLWAVADRLLLRADGLVYNVALLRVVVDEAPLAESLPLADLLRLGASIGPVTGTMGGRRLPVTFQIFEFHPGEVPASYRQESQHYASNGVDGSAVGVGVIAVDSSRAKTWSNFPGLVSLSHTRLARRAVRERNMTTGERRAILATSGFQPSKVLLGAVVGAVLGVAATLLLRVLGARAVSLYAVAAVMGAVAGAVISVKSCRVLHSTLSQATLAGVGAVGVVLVFDLATVARPSLWMLIAVAAAAFLSFSVGAIDNPQGR